MPGLYLHIPFCRKACHYCDFHFSTTLQRKAEFTESLCLEIAQRKSEAGNAIQQTVYFGGGTPSLLSENELASIFSTIHEHYKISDDAEITLEANPDDVTSENLLMWKAAGINRLSIGIQSFYDSDLEFMNRTHNSAEAKRCVKLAQDAGFSNITIDLIYGSPTTSHEMWESNLAEALSLKVPHISAYNLTVEERTALAQFVKKGKARPVDDKHSSEQFMMLVNALTAAGMDHYEISNFGFPGKHSVHNSNYWKGEKYIGFGPSAHSFNGNERRWNISNNARYIDALKKNESYSETELLSENDRYNEYVMIRLRTSEGISTEEILNRFGEEKLQLMLNEAEQWIRSGEIIRDEKRIYLSFKGKLLADRIASDLFCT